MSRNATDENPKKTKFDCNKKITNKDNEMFAKDLGPHFMPGRSEFEKEVSRRIERIEKLLRNVCESQKIK